MKRLLRRRPISPSTALALVSLMVALGGTSYAAARIGARSIGSTELKRPAVARSNLMNNAVTGAKVQDDSLTGRDIVESTLGEVRAARHASTADAAVVALRAGAAAGVDRVFYRVAHGAVGRAGTDPADPTVTIPASGTATATCDDGQFVVGGGAKVDDTDLQSVIQQYPDNGGRAWTVTVANEDAGDQHGFNVYAICLPADAAG